MTSMLITYWQHKLNNIMYFFVHSVSFLLVCRLFYPLHLHVRVRVLFIVFTIVFFNFVCQAR